MQPFVIEENHQFSWWRGKLKDKITVFRRFGRMPIRCLIVGQEQKEEKLLWA